MPEMTTTMINGIDIHYSIWILCAINWKIGYAPFLSSQFDRVSYLYFVQFSNHPYMICPLTVFVGCQKIIDDTNSFVTTLNLFTSVQPLCIKVGVHPWLCLAGNWRPVAGRGTNCFYSIDFGANKPGVFLCAFVLLDNIAGFYQIYAHVVLVRLGFL